MAPLLLLEAEVEAWENLEAFFSPLVWRLSTGCLREHVARFSHLVRLTPIRKQQNPPGHLCEMTHFTERSVFRISFLLCPTARVLVKFMLMTSFLLLTLQTVANKTTRLPRKKKKIDEKPSFPIKVTLTDDPGEVRVLIWIMVNNCTAWGRSL